MRVELEARGGVQPYSWRITGGDCALELSRSEDPRTTIELQGTPEASCTATIEITDDADRVGEAVVPVTVHDIPRLATESLRDACPNEEYSELLSAEGGDTSVYEFHALADGREYVTGTDRLEYLVTSREPITFDVWVNQGACESPHQSLVLKVKEESALSCPVITPSRALLADPCAGMPYTDSLVVTRASDGEWETIETPPGLKLERHPIDPTQATLEGVASWTGTAPFSARFHSTDGRVFRYAAKPALAAREKCWFGYVSKAENVSQFRLFDPERRIEELFPRSNSGEVRDFRFSPDGRFAVYESQADTEPAALTLLELKTLRETRLTGFSGSVEHYAWSPDASLLAASFRTATGEVKLGGIAVSAAGAGSNTVEYLQPVSAAVDSRLTWFGTHYLAYARVPKPEEFDLFGPFIEHTRVVDDSFAEPFPHSTWVFFEPFSIRGYPDGFLGSNTFGLFAFFAPTTDALDKVYLHPEGNAFAPSGRYYGRSLSGVLSVFDMKSQEPDAAPLAKSASGDRCDLILAWAENQEKIACVNEVSTPIPAERGQVLTFDLALPSNSLIPRALPGAYEYPKDIAPGRRRLFSRNSRYLAFGTNEYLYVSDLVNRKLIRLEPLERSEQAATHMDLGFSPNERFLIEQRGNHMVLYDLETTPHTWSEYELLESSRVETPATCQEPPSVPWCGAPASPRDFIWSTDSAFVAARTRLDATNSGSIAIVNIKRILPAIDETTELNCTGCGPTFAFQP